MLLRVSTIALIIILAAGLSAQNLYTVTPLPVPALASNLTATGINNSGEIVAHWDGPNTGLVPSYGATLYQSGPSGVQELTLPVQYVGGISNSGKIACATFQQVPQMVNPVTFAWEACVMGGGDTATIGFLPGDNDSNAIGVNDAGQVVGVSDTLPTDTVPFYSHGEAFLYSHGVITGLGYLPGDTKSGAFAINNSGQVVGYSSSSTGSHAFSLASGYRFGRDR